MIHGKIRSQEAIIDLEISGAAPSSQQVEAVIDTGYNGFLTLPSQLVSALQLSFGGARQGMLADGSIIQLELYFVTVAWHGQPRSVAVLKSEEAPLVGMALLEGSQLTMDVVDGGDVRIEEMPTGP